MIYDQSEGEFIGTVLDVSGAVECGSVSSAGAVAGTVFNGPVDFVGFRAYLNSDFNHAATTAQITGWTQEFDEGADWASDKFIAPSNGYYHFGLKITTDAMDSGQVEMELQFRHYNSSDVSQGHKVLILDTNEFYNTAGTTEPHSLTFYELFYMAATDYCEVWYKASDATGNFLGYSTEGQRSSWWGYRVGV